MPAAGTYPEIFIFLGGPIFSDIFSNHDRIMGFRKRGCKPKTPPPEYALGQQLD